jgi:hypothetical protein
MDMEAADEEELFVNVLVEDEEEMEDLKDLESIKRRKEEESMRLEKGVDNRVERRQAMKKEDTMGDESEWIREQLGNSPRTRRRQEIMDMDVDEMEKEIKRTEEAIKDNLRRRAEQAGITVAAGDSASSRKRTRLVGNKLPWMLMILGVIGLNSIPVQTFTAYDCSNRSNIGESYALLEPDACHWRG